MKTLLSVALAAAPLAAASVLLTPAVHAAGRGGWIVAPAAAATPALCAMARVPDRTPAVADARELLDSLAKFTSSRLDAAWAGIEGPLAGPDSGRSATSVELIRRSPGSGFAPTGTRMVSARSRSCL